LRKSREAIAAAYARQVALDPAMRCRARIDPMLARCYGCTVRKLNLDRFGQLPGEALSQ